MDCTTCGDRATHLVGFVSPELQVSSINGLGYLSPSCDECDKVDMPDIDMYAVRGKIPPEIEFPRGTLVEMIEFGEPYLQGMVSKVCGNRRDLEILHSEDGGGFDYWPVASVRPIQTCYGCGGGGMVRTSPDDADTCPSCDGTGRRG